MFVLPGIEARVGTFAQHRDRLLELGSLAKRMRPLLAEEPFARELLRLPLEGNELDMSSVVSDFLDRLFCLARGAAGLGRNRDALQSRRFERCFPEDVIDNPGKSLPRRVIWEPVLTFWRSRGRRVGYSPDGPVMRVLTIIHQQCGIEPPRPESVRQTIRNLHGSER